MLLLLASNKIETFLTRNRNLIGVLCDSLIEAIMQLRGIDGFQETETDREHSKAGLTRAQRAQTTK